MYFYFLFGLIAVLTF